MIKWWDSLTSNCKSGPHKCLREIWKQPGHFPVNRTRNQHQKSFQPSPRLGPWRLTTTRRPSLGSLDHHGNVWCCLKVQMRMQNFHQGNEGLLQSSWYLRTLSASLNYDHIQLDSWFFANHNIWSLKQTCLCCVWHCSDLRLKLNPFKELPPPCLISGNFDPKCCRSYSYNRWAVSGSMFFRCVALRYSKSCS